MEDPKNLTHVYDLLIEIHERIGRLEGRMSVLLWMVGGVLLSILGKLIVSQVVSAARALVQP